MDALTLVHICSIVAIIGSLLYSISDVFLLAYEVGPRESVPEAAEADIRPYALQASMASGFANTASLAESRLAWGGLLGVLATPLVFAGLWPVYYALRPAGPSFALTTVIFLAYALIIGAFVHGSFIYVEQNAKALIHMSTNSRSIFGPTFRLQQQVLFTSYAVIAVAALVAAILFSVAVAWVDTLLPRWMAVVNPVTTTLVWLVLKRLLPQSIAKYTEGAGFNIGFLLFFLLLAVNLW